MSQVYEHCIIGHGLTGTAACKYLAATGKDVVLVGPSEGQGAHGACYDEGRIYRILDPQESWARLAEKSIGHYEDIAKESGVDFYEERGLLIFGTRDAFMKQTIEVAAKMQTRLEEMSPSQLSTRFPWLRVPGCCELGLLQKQQAGHLSPRRLTRAQLQLAMRHGAAYRDATVETVTREAVGEPFSVSLAGGETLRARKVLVAAGVYSSVLPLLPENVVVSLTGSQALLAEISAETAAQLRAGGMPCMIYEGPTEEECFYLLPPIQYPDGAWLLKIGPSTKFAPPLKSVAEVDAWFRQQELTPEFQQVALQTLAELFPGLEVLACRPLLCVTDSTPTLNAYIDTLAPGWGICSGGNGWAAKSSDEIGHLAAQMMALPGHWGPDPDLPRSWFRAVTPGTLRPNAQLETLFARVEAASDVLASRPVEALEVLTQVLCASPRIRDRPDQVAAEVQSLLTQRWTAVPSVLCSPSSGCAWAPAHPFVALSAGKLTVLVVLSS